MVLYDATGKEYPAYILQEWIDATSMSGGPACVPGLKKAVLEDGTPLNYIDENTFETVSHHPQRLSRIRP